MSDSGKREKNIYCEESPGPYGWKGKQAQSLYLICRSGFRTLSCRYQQKQSHYLRGEHTHAELRKSQDQLLGDKDNFPRISYISAVLVL